jgi:hypothetical protein
MPDSSLAGQRMTQAGGWLNEQAAAGHENCTCHENCAASNQYRTTQFACTRLRV